MVKQPWSLGLNSNLTFSHDPLYFVLASFYVALTVLIFWPLLGLRLCCREVLDWAYGVVFTMYLQPVSMLPWKKPLPSRVELHTLLTHVKQYFHNKTGVWLLATSYIMPGITDWHANAKSSSLSPEKWMRRTVSAGFTLALQLCATETLSFLPPTWVIILTRTVCIFYCTCLSAFAEHLSLQCKPIWP